MTSLTYSDHAQSQNAQAIAACKSKIADLWKRLVAKSKTISGDVIDGVNLMREIGLELQSMCGHETMSQVFWNNHCKNEWDFSFATAKIFMSVARKEQAKKVKAFAEAIEYFAPMFFSTGQLELPVRAGAQSASTIPALQIFVTKFVGQLKPFKKLPPMNTWDTDDLNLFLSETAWVIDERDRAKKILEEKK